MGSVAEETLRWAWTPRVPLTAAEKRVDFPLHNSHIVQRRLAVERYATPAAKRLAFLVAEHGLPTVQVQQELEGRLYVSLTRSVQFGYDQVQRELRGTRPEIRASLRLPGIGDRGRVALTGLTGIHGLVRSRAALVAANVADAAAAAKHKAALKPGATAVATRLAVADMVRRTLHNDVLQLVSEAINLGRAAAALEILAERRAGTGSTVLAADYGAVPEFAMRSEQLDERTCDECDAAHGEIVEVGSSEFYDEMPPAGCAGGGRCRGIYVFGEGSEFTQVSPEKLADTARTKAASAEPHVTSALSRSVHAQGGKLEGLPFRLKSRESMARKIAADATEKQITIEESASRIVDGLRYTAVFDSEAYAQASADMLAQLQSDFGYKVVRVKNFWDGTEYKGINAVLENENGYRFELQFHTPESLASKDQGHLLYEQWRVLDPKSEQARTLVSRMNMIWRRVAQPRGAGGIGEKR